MLRIALEGRKLPHKVHVVVVSIEIEVVDANSTEAECFVVLDKCPLQSL